MTADFAAANRAINDLYEHIGTRVAQIRAHRNLTQAELAHNIGVTRSSVANLEAGRQRCPLHILIAVAQTLDTSMAELLAETTLPGLANPLPIGEHPIIPALQHARRDLREALGALDKLQLVFDGIGAEPPAAP